MPRTTFLFWNLNKKPLAGLVAELAEIRGVDVVILAECESPTAILLALNGKTAEFHFTRGNCPAIKIFTRFPADFLEPIYETSRISIRHLKLPARPEVLLSTVHLPSKLHWSDESQTMECVELVRAIEEQEAVVRHQRTIVVGDFNMNPFEAGLVSSVGMNSVMSRQISSRLHRTVQDREYHFFYNPMWAQFGDAAGPTAGSYYHDNGQHLNYYWNLFDQVLLRPALAKNFSPNSLGLVSIIGTKSLVNLDGRPNRALASDHLPLVFEVEF